MDQYPLSKYFDDAAEKVKIHASSASKPPTNDDLLNLYSLFKQAKEGDNNTSQPSFYQLEAKAKWNAWNSQKGKSQDQAKHEYVSLAMNFLPEEIKSNYK